MKIVRYLFIVFLFLASSCTKESYVPVSSKTTLRIDVSDCSNLTKTAINESGKASQWYCYDRIGVFACYEEAGTTKYTDAKLQYFIPDVDGRFGDEYKNSLSFSGELTNCGEQAYSYYAVYPYRSLSISTSPEKFPVSLPSVQYPSGDSYDPMADILLSEPIHNATGSIQSRIPMRFTHLFGILRFAFGKSISDTYGDELVETVTIRSAGNALSGTFTANYETALLTPVATADSVVLDYRGRVIKLNDCKPYFILPDGSFSSVSIEISTASHKITLNRTGLPVKRNSIVEATLNFKDGDIASSNTSLLPHNPNSLKILLIGHSFGEDSFQYLPNITVAAGLPNVTVARLFIGNCSLQQHWQNFSNTSKSYTFYYCDAGSTSWKSKGSYSIQNALDFADWDIVIFQDSVGLEGQYSGHQPYLDNLIQAIIARLGRRPVFAWNNFWSLASGGYTDWEWQTERYLFPTYDYDPYIMWKANVASAREVLDKTGVDIVVSTGTAIQNLRYTSLNATPYDLCRDGAHADNGAGRYVVAATMFETLVAPCFNKTIVGNTFKPSSSSYVKVTSENLPVLQLDAVLSTRNKFTISRLEAIGGNESVSSSSESFVRTDTLLW